MVVPARKENLQLYSSSVQILLQVLHTPPPLSVQWDALFAMRHLQSPGSECTTKWVLLLA